MSEQKTAFITIVGRANVGKIIDIKQYSRTKNCGCFAKTADYKNQNYGRLHKGK